MMHIVICWRLQNFAVNVFLNQAHVSQTPVCTWSLTIVSMWMSVYVCVHVCPEAINN